MVVLAPISTSSPMLTAPSCGTFTHCPSAWAKPKPSLPITTPGCIIARLPMRLCSPTKTFATRRLRSPIRLPRAIVHPGSQVHDSAWVDANAVIEGEVRIEADVVIGRGCVIERGSRIGEGSRLVANVFVGEHSRIGRRAMIHPGVVIGSDGFGLALAEGQWVKVPQLGAVSIGDDVEIGANTTIDRGTLDDTVIEDGAKLDNQIQVAHNVIIGAHTAIAGCTGIAGSARIGASCTIGGGEGIVGHTEIVDDVHITGMSFVAHSIREPGLYSSGTPLEPNREWRKNYARFHQLDDMARRQRGLEKAVKEHDDE